MWNPNARARTATARAHVSEGDEPEGLAHEARELGQERPPLAPAALADHPVHRGHPAVRGQDQHHGVVGDFLDERVGHIGDRDPACGGRVDVDRVDAHAAERDHLAALHPVDDALGDAAPLGVERVGVARLLDEILVGLGCDLDDLGVDRREGLQLELVAHTRDRKACSARGHHLELRHARLLLGRSSVSVRRADRRSRIVAQATGPRGPQPCPASPALDHRTIAILV
jgi:hypothetical protein